MLSRRDTRITGLLAFGAVLLALGQVVAGLDAGLLHLAPAIMLLLPLLAGRYVGEERIARARSQATVRVPRPVAARLPRALRATPLRGGLLLAAGLGRRAARPPHVVA